MCGIVGLYLKNPKLQPKLGEMFKPMIIEMTHRGPDSAGVAIYRNPVKKSQVKFSLAHDDAAYDWKKVDAGLEKALKCDATIKTDRQPLHPRDRCQGSRCGQLAQAASSR